MWVDDEGDEHEDDCPGKRGWFEWHKVGGDTPHQDVIELIWLLEAEGIKIIFVSGREDVCYEETRQWLVEHYWLGDDPNEFPETPEEIVLLMRKAGDGRQDAVIKLEIFDREIRNNYNVIGCFDDRNQVVNAYRSIGLRVYQVKPGDF